MASPNFAARMEKIFIKIIILNVAGRLPLEKYNEDCLILIISPASI